MSTTPLPIDWTRGGDDYLERIVAPLGQRMAAAGFDDFTLAPADGDGASRTAIANYKGHELELRLQPGHGTQSTTIHVEQIVDGRVAARGHVAASNYGLGEVKLAEAIENGESERRLRVALRRSEGRHDHLLVRSSGGRPYLIGPGLDGPSGLRANGFFGHGGPAFGSKATQNANATGSFGGAAVVRELKAALKGIGDEMDRDYPPTPAELRRRR